MPRRKDVSDNLKAFDSQYHSLYSYVAGIDEAGRGPLAGPVVCACVMMDEATVIPYVNDSKKLSEKLREELYSEIIEKAVCYGVGICDNNTIDDINILNATKKAMTEAVNSLTIKPDILLIDALVLDDLRIRQEPIVKGDAKSFCIAAASIVAKVTRDKMMAEYDKLYPEYGFASHKGYGTKAHYEALRAYGITPIHRKTFLKTLH